MKTKYTIGGRHIAVLPPAATLRQLNAARATLAAKLGTAPGRIAASTDLGRCTLYCVAFRPAGATPPAPLRLCVG